MGVTFLVRNSNPVVASHQVHGFKVLPGLTYIDLIYQFFRRSGHHFAELELRHLAIHQPMVLPGNDDILVEIQAPEIRPGVWRVLIEGTRQQDGRPVAEKACYAMAEMHRCKVRFDPSEHQTEPPVPQGRLDSDDIYATFRPRGLVHSGFMQVRGVGFSTPTHAFADVGLSEEAKDSNTQYMFHPALLDGGVTCASGMLPGSDIDDGSPGGGLYIPLSYDGFRATSLVRGRCIARIGHSTLRRRNDLFLVTVDFLDEGGRKVAELRNLALKALRRQDAISEASGRSTGKDTPIVSLASGTRVPKPPAPAAKLPAAADTTNDAPTSLRALIAGGIADRLGVSPADIDPSVGYYEMGLDSVGLLHIVKLLEERFGMSLSPTLLFEYTTIDELTDHLVERYGDVLVSVPAQASTPVPVTGAEIESRVSAREPALDEPIAIIGMAGRFPLAKNIGELWRNLKAGKDCIAEVPAERWDWHLFDGIEAIAGREVSRWGGFVADVDRFDARFFRVTPRAAEAIDPQERLFLEVSWEAVEDAGYTPRNLVPPHGAGQRRPVGVFAGVMHKDYLLWQAQRLFDGQLQSLAMSNAPIANRVSYFCNFHGPSVVVDTLCSSSLTAVHMATESLRQGECQVALAGGVNLSLHPGKYLTFALLGMHSSDGRCRTFGEGGDGYVAGEGVGVVVLKPLARAIEDNDHVYAVIRGCSVNHVGAVSGISVPSPVAQADLIADCMTKAGVDPRSISYVEAHGTGTALGDPIEIEGLGRAFRTGTDAVGYCAIGSIKSNMGHTESAAGIAGIIKVALQLHHATLVPSLHGERPNPHIDWATTPFVVQTCTAPWNRPRVVVNGEETVHPRRAAVSSFGAAGSNAHAILEEYVERDDPFRAPPSTPAIVPLSAQTPAQVRESAQRLLAYLADGDAVATGDRLHRLAHTLQRGRESHAHRVAFVAGDLDSLQRAMRAFLAEATEKHDVFEGAVSPSGRGTGGVMSSPVGIRSALAEGRYADVARAWVAGDLLDWSAIYADPAPRRLPLPTYPFAGERYWVEESAPAERRASSTAGGRPVLHPIVHENTSSLDEQRFTSRFDGTEFFFRDHVVNGAPVLPGVAYLEMAHAALARAMGDASPGHWRLRNAIWVQPIVATGTVASVHVGLHRMPSGELGCEIFAGESTERTIHFQCVATPCEDAPPRIDLDAVRAGCDDELPVAECYELLEAGGLRYGESFRSMRGVWVGKDAEQAPIVLVRLDLPDVALPEANRFGLHPSILDGALQASLGLMRVPGDVSAAPARMTPYVPYALDMLEVFAACHGAAYAVIRNGIGSSAALRKLEVALCDDAGNVLVRMRGFAARRMEGGDPAVAPAEPVTFHERWYEAPIPDGATTPGRIECVHAVATSRDVFDNAATTVDFRLLPAETAPAPQDLGAADALVVLWAVERAPAPSDIPALIAFLRAAALADQPPSRIVLAALCRTPMERACVDAWIALVPSLRRIAPYALQIVGTVVDAHADTHVAMRSALDNALRDLADPAAASAFHEDGERRVRRMVPTPRTDTRPVLRDGGTYLITGGLGGLGGHLAAHLARRYRATLLLIGRSAPDAAAQARMRKWEAHGARIIHARADVADIASLRAAMDVAQENGRRIDGIFHAAGIAAAGSLFDSAPEDIARVLAPKVAGTLALEEAFAGHPLDFICHFSSSSAVLGDFGACAYAVANRFQAACVAAAPAGVRRIAIQWPLWRDGGLGMGDAEATASYLASSGQRALDTEEGIDLLERLLGEAHGVQLVLAGAESSLRRLLASTGVAVETPSVRPATEAQPTPSTDPLASRMLRSLCALLGNAVKLPLDRVSAETPLDDYGFDSILAMQMTNELEKSFGSLPKTLFFEHHDLVSLNGYLLREHRPAVARLLGVADMPDAHVAATAAPARPPRSAPSILGGHAAPRCGAIEDDIAIVGFNGRFPQAADLDAFWRNLRSGTDSITGIPPERWDHDARFDARKAFFGKTYCRWGGFLDDVDAFDPLFFNMTPVEARFTDPQQRLYLETVWNLLEENGYTRDALRDEHAGNVGVYVGSMYNQYGATSDDEGVDALGTSPQAAIANRVSYFFGLHGPSIAVDTMCSSAFAAIHMACTDLRAGVCTLAIAGGVNLSLHPKKYITLGQAQMLASQAIGRSFGKTDGYLPSEAVGAVLLKPLSAAIEDADTILGVINGSALNHGGRSNGYSVPNPDAQAAVMREALRQARMSASSIGYVEAAANGSPLGDAIEVAALRTVFSGLSEHACAIGAVKSNIGHAEAASGMAQLAKVLLQMRHGERVPTIQTEPPNPAIVLEGSPFRLPRAVEPWPRERTRTALINSFGAGGSNACVVVSEYEQVSADAVPAEPFADRYVVIVSARGVDRLHALVRALAEAVDADPRMRMGDLAYTLQCGREAMPHRLALVVGDRVALRAAFDAWLAGDKRPVPGTTVFSCGPAEAADFHSFTSGSAGDALLETFLREADAEKLAMFWARGGKVPWARLHPRRRRIVALPGYPFARERLWLPSAPQAIAPPAITLPDAPRRVETIGYDGRLGVPVLHPLLQMNSSDIGEYRFSSTFSGDEPWAVRDEVRGLRLLPDVLCLEMLRAAVERVAGRPGDAVRLLDLRWNGPVEIASGPVTVHVGMRLAAAGRLDVEVYSLVADDGDGPRRTHLRGTAVPAENSSDEGGDLGPRRVVAANRMPAPQWIGVMRRIGLEFGAPYRRNGEVARGADEEGQPFTVVDIDASPAATEMDAGFGLPPALVNIALQAAALQIARHGDDERTVVLPAALACRELWMGGRVAEARTAWIRRGDMGDDRAIVVDIDLVDAAGIRVGRCVGVRDAAFASCRDAEPDGSATEGYEIGGTSLLALSHRAVVAPRNELETTLLDIWREVLGFSSIGIFDSFLDLGGSSLLAARVVAMIDEHYRVTIEVPALLRPEGTIARLSELLVMELARQVAAESEG